MALDIEKAFDSVAWPYMLPVLETMGFTPEFLKLVQLLYSCPSAQVKLGGELSEPFPVRSGRRQGCPQSPALFAILMELVAMDIKRASAVVDIRVGTLVEKIAMYVDNLILFLNDPRPSLKEVLRILSEFSIYSLLQINWGKSQILPIDREMELTPPCLFYGLPVSDTLGIEMSSDTAKFCILNFVPLLDHMKSKLRPLANLPLCVNLFKMNLLPGFLYVLRHAPMWIPKIYFKIY